MTLFNKINKIFIIFKKRKMISLYIFHGKKDEEKEI